MSLESSEVHEADMLNDLVNGNFSDLRKRLSALRGADGRLTLARLVETLLADRDRSKAGTFFRLLQRMRDEASSLWSTTAEGEPRQSEEA